MNSMFCFQCEQTAGGKGCTKIGVCGKTPEVSQKHDELIGALIEVARLAEGKSTPKSTDELMIQALFTTITNVNFDSGQISDLTDRVKREGKNLGNINNFDARQLFTGNEDVVSLRSTLLFGLKGMAAYALHANLLGKSDEEITSWFYKGMRAVGQILMVDEWLSLIMELGRINLKCMQLLDEAHTNAFGHPRPTNVTLKIEKGPFIVVTGHDLLDLKQLLEQTEGRGVNIYTHGEMLPAHGYPKLNTYRHLKGNFGTAWQNQQKEFADIPAPVLYTTNCLMPPRPNYSDRIFTTSVVGYPQIPLVNEIDGKKDFSLVIKRAIELGGWKEDKLFTGINGGSQLLTGFGHNTVLGIADKLIQAIKKGTLKHLFLVGGCDGAKKSRNYYTEFVKRTPHNSLVLTLACGKYRFNDLNIGYIDGLPRLVDMGQCNDAYSAIKVSLALADAFGCEVNDLPLSLVVSWYEQKAIAILITLLSLGMRNIYLGPSMPAFLSSNVKNILIDKFSIKTINKPEEDIRAMMS